jgi:hypothetical protein
LAERQPHRNDFLLPDCDDYLAMRLSCSLCPQRIAACAISIAPDDAAIE